MRMEWKGSQRGEDTCIHVADSLHCTAKTNNTVKQLYSNKKEKRERERDSVNGLQKLEKVKKKKKKYFPLESLERRVAVILT